MKSTLNQILLMCVVLFPMFAAAECAPTKETKCHTEQKNVVVTLWRGYASCQLPNKSWVTSNYIEGQVQNTVLLGAYGFTCFGTGLQPFQKTVVETKQVCKEVDIPPIYTAGCDIAKACTHFGTTSINNVSTFAVNAVSHCGACGTRTGIQTGGASGTVVHFSCGQ